MTAADVKHDTQPVANEAEGMAIASRAVKNRHPFWVPRMWCGMRLGAWFRLLRTNGFTISPARVPRAVHLTFLAAMNSVFAAMQDAIYGRRIAETAVRDAPIFILGHWRTGTTLLHELLALDERHTCPTTYDCFAAPHSLVTAPLLAPLMKYLVPARRPMDDMAFGLDRPQEDEFALCVLGAPSPYCAIAFPNRPSQYEAYADLEGLSPAELEAWKRTFLRFLKQLTLRDPRRIVLKSPLHTCRIKVLTELFPDARFIHMVRDPYAVFPSTIRLWRALHDLEGLQRPTHNALTERVFRTLDRMYARFDEQRERVAPSRFCELRYEDLVRNPLAQLETVYDALGLGGFDRVRPAVERYLTGLNGYKPNRHRLPPAIQQQISHRWGWYARRYGYPIRNEPAAEA